MGDRFVFAILLMVTVFSINTCKSRDTASSLVKESESKTKLKSLEAILISPKSSLELVSALQQLKKWAKTPGMDLSDSSKDILVKYLNGNGPIEIRDSNVREVAEMIGHWKIGRAIDSLIAIIERTKDDPDLEYVNAVGKIGPPSAIKAIPILEEVLKGPKKWAPGAAAWSLMMIGSEAAVTSETLASLLVKNDEMDSDTAYRFVVALRSFGVQAKNHSKSLSEAAQKILMSPHKYTTRGEAAMLIPIAMPANQGIPILVAGYAHDNRLSIQAIKKSDRNSYQRPRDAEPKIVGAITRYGEQGIQIVKQLSSDRTTENSDWATKLLMFIDTKNLSLPYREANSLSSPESKRLMENQLGHKIMWCEGGHGSQWESSNNIAAYTISVKCPGYGNNSFFAIDNSAKIYGVRVQFNNVDGEYEDKRNELLLWFPTSPVELAWKDRDANKSANLFKRLTQALIINGRTNLVGHFSKVTAIALRQDEPVYDTTSKINGRPKEVERSN